jgi:hypothetical protein
MNKFWIGAGGDEWGFYHPQKMKVVKKR